MENLKEAKDIWEFSKALFIVLLLIAALYFVVPPLYNGGEAAKKAQLELIQRENAELRAFIAVQKRENDSLRQECQKKDDDKYRVLQKQNEALRQANDRYNNAMMKTYKAQETIKSIKKTVNNEIK